MEPARRGMTRGGPVYIKKLLQMGKDLFYNLSIWSTWQTSSILKVRSGFTHVTREPYSEQEENDGGHYDFPAVR